MLRRFGVKEDKFESFLADILNRCCNELGLTAERIAFYIANVAKLSDDMPISEIPNYILHKGDQKKRIEQEIKDLELKFADLRSKKSEIENSTTSALQNYEITQEKLNWYLKTKEELEKYGITVDDISKLGIIADNVAKIFGYDSQKVVDGLSNLQSLKGECEQYQKEIEKEKHECHTLQNLHLRLKEDVNACNQTLAPYAQLFDMGFDLKELKLLWHTIKELAYANNIPREDAVRKFFKDVEDHYDDKLGFESKVGNMQEELNHLDQKKTKLLIEINVIPQLALVLAKLLSVDDNNNIEDIKLLVDQIREAGGIREARYKLTNQSIIGDRKSSVSLSGNSIHNNNNSEYHERKTCNVEEIKNAITHRKDDKDSNYNENPDKYTMIVPDIYLLGNAALPRGVEKEEKLKTSSGLEEKENEETAKPIEESLENFKICHESP